MRFGLHPKDPHSLSSPGVPVPSWLPVRRPLLHTCPLLPAASRPRTTRTAEEESVKASDILFFVMPCPAFSAPLDVGSLGQVT